MLECADCHRRVRDEDAARCPSCGGQLLAPPTLLQRRAVVVGVTGATGLLLVAMIGVRLAIFYIAYVDRALAFFGLSLSQAGEAQRRRQMADIVRSAERGLVPYPGAQRLQTENGRNATDAPVIDVCWQTADTIEAVVAFYRGTLPPAGWRLLGSGSASQVGAQRGQVRLLLQRPDATAGATCPAGTTYVLSLTAVQSFARNA